MNVRSLRTDAGESKCPLWVDAVEKGLRASPNSDSADSVDHLLGGGDDGAAE